MEVKRLETILIMCMKNLCTNKCLQKAAVPFLQIPSYARWSVAALVGWGCACTAHLFWTHPLGPTAPLRLHGWNLNPTEGGRMMQDPEGPALQYIPSPSWHFYNGRSFSLLPESSNGILPKSELQRQLWSCGRPLPLESEALEIKLSSTSYLGLLTNTYAGWLPQL